MSDWVKDARGRRAAAQVDYRNCAVITGCMGCDRECARERDARRLWDATCKADLPRALAVIEAGDALAVAASLYRHGGSRSERDQRRLDGALAAYRKARNP